MTDNRRTQILLLYPKTGMDFGSTIAPPHSLLSVAAPLFKIGYRVKILDQRVGLITEDILRRQISPELYCVGISAMVGSQIYFALSLAKMIRRLTNGKIPIVWGGCQPSVIPEQVIANENADYVVIGEGDYTLLDMINCWNSRQPLDNVLGIMFKNGNGIIKTPARPLFDVEKLLPIPWELVNVENYIHRDMYISNRNRVLDIGQTSRGCPFECAFCSSSAIRQRKWRPMSYEKSLNMIVETVHRYNLDGFWLRDDEFYIDRKRSNAIFEGMIREGLDVSFYTSGTRCDVFTKATEDDLNLMKKAGAHTLKFGAESGSQRILDLMQKKIKIEQIVEANIRSKKHGLVPAFAFIAGYPTETFEDIEKTIDLMFKLKDENPQVQFEEIAIYTALPGTPSWDLAIQYGLMPPRRLEDWTNWLFDDYDLDGRRNPWYKTRKESIWLGNISYMSMLVNSLQNSIGSIRNIRLRSFLSRMAKPAGVYYSNMLRNKKYHFAPELRFIRFLRNKLFYRGKYTVK